MQKYKEINGNDYVKGSRTTINETMQSIQSMNSGTAFPTNNLFEGMKCYRTDLKKTYTLTDVENNTWVEDDTASKLATARKINITGDATGAAAFDGSGDISINTTVSQAAHADKAKLLDGFNGYDGGGWGTTIGKVINGFQESGGGSIQWRANGGMIYQKVDGTYWQREGAYEVIDTSTVNNYAPTKTGSGASGTWGINISGNAATATRATTAAKADGLTSNLVFPDIGDVATSNKISWNGSTDGADIYYQTTASDQGNLVLNLRDDANCCLRIACNGVFKSYFSPVDGNFHGNVNGNADSATNADKLDGYHANDLLNKIYPVGSIYMSMSATNPATLFGVGTWARISQGRMLLGADDSTYKAGATGGEATHTLTAAEMPAHSHTGTTSTNGAHSHTTKMNSGKYGGGAWMQGGGNDGTFNTSTNGDHNHMFTTDNSGGGAAHNNMPPYLVCYIWQRTA